MLERLNSCITPTSMRVIFMATKFGTLIHVGSAAELALTAQSVSVSWKKLQLSGHI